MKNESTIKSIIIGLLSSIILALIIGGFNFYFDTKLEIAVLKTQLENLRETYNEDIGELNDRIYELKK